jgi:hypothetical protein
MHACNEGNSNHSFLGFALSQKHKLYSYYAGWLFAFIGIGGLWAHLGHQKSDDDQRSHKGRTRRAAERTGQYRLDAQAIKVKSMMV